MNATRRRMLAGLASLPLVAGLTATSANAEAKPLTTAGLARTLLGLADRAEAQGMRAEASAILDAALVVLKGGKL